MIGEPEYGGKGSYPRTVTSETFRANYDAIFRPRCEGCGNLIDPGCCHCGMSMEGHPVWDSPAHTPTPIGCTCGYDKTPPTKETLRPCKCVLCATIRRMDDEDARPFIDAEGNRYSEAEVEFLDLDTPAAGGQHCGYVVKAFAPKIVSARRDPVLKNFPPPVAEGGQ